MPPSSTRIAASLGEWPLGTRPRALDRRELWPALIEFCRYGGILRIDGRSTGVLPEHLPPLGIGAARRRSSTARARAIAERG